jgi:hypothetical protein
MAIVPEATALFITMTSSSLSLIRSKQDHGRAVISISQLVTHKTSSIMTLVINGSNKDLATMDK